MKPGRILVLAVILVAASVLVGCDFIDQLFGTAKPDLVATSVETLKDASGQISGVRVVLTNSGSKDAAGVDFSVVISADTTVSTTSDAVIYTGTVDLTAGQEKKIDVTNADIATYTAGAAVTLPDGKYYYGVSVDPKDTIAEKDELNNEVVSAATTWYFGSKPMMYGVQGTVTIPALLQYYTGSAYVSVPPATYDFYCLAAPSSVAVPAGGTVDLKAYAGWTKFTMQYFGNQITMNYSCGVPVQGSYYVVVFMDRNADGLMSVTSFGPPAEPYGLWPTSTTGPNPTTINQDVPSANITLNSGGM